MGRWWEWCCHQTDVENADDHPPAQGIPEIGAGDATEAEQIPWQGATNESSNALANESSMATANYQTAPQPLPPPDPLETL